MSKTIKIKVLSVLQKYDVYSGVTYLPVRICNKHGNVRVVCLDDLYVNPGDEIEVKDISTKFVTLYEVLQNYTQKQMVKDFVVKNRVKTI